MKRTSLPSFFTVAVAVLVLGGPSAWALTPNTGAPDFEAQVLAAETAAANDADNVDGAAEEIRQAMIAIRPELAVAAPGGGACPVACASVCAYAAAVASVTCEAHAYAVAVCPDGTSVWAEGHGYATATAVGFGLACATACTDGTGFGFGGGGGGAVGGGGGGGGVIVNGPN
jgi:hypothetical protein